MESYCSSVFHQTLPEAIRWEVILWSLWLGYLHSRATRTCGPYFELAHIPTAPWALGTASELRLGGGINIKIRYAKRISLGFSTRFVPKYHISILGVIIRSTSIKKITIRILPILTPTDIAELSSMNELKCVIKLFLIRAWCYSGCRNSSPIAKRISSIRETFQVIFEAWGESTAPVDTMEQLTRLQGHQSCFRDPTLWSQSLGSMILQSPRVNAEQADGSIPNEPKLSLSL